MSFAPTYPSLQMTSGRDVETGEGASARTVVSLIWLWLRTCLYSMGLCDNAGQGAEYADLIETPCRCRDCRHNRANRHLNHYFAKKSEGGTIPPVRNLAPFYRLVTRQVTPTQFLERLCRLSCAGRIQIYRIVYYSHRMVREAFMARFECGVLRAPKGLWQAHLWPT